MTYMLELPFPPSINNYYGARGNTRFLKPAGKLFREQVAWYVKSRKVAKLEGRLSVVVRLMPPDKRRRDVDNSSKALLDALMHAGCFEDDSQIDDLHIVRGSTFGGGKCEVLIGEIK